MSKKGQMVALIAIAIAAVVFLVIVWPKLAVLLKGAGSGSTCNLNLFLAAAVKAGSLGFSSIPVGCEAKYITVGKEEIDARKNIAAKRIKKYGDDTTGYYKDVKMAFPIDSSGHPTTAALDEWAFDSIFANDLKDCWNKVWHGKLDIFKRGWIFGDKFCIVCSVVTFGEDLPASLRNRNMAKPITSLKTWMNAEPYYKTTYYDFVADGLVPKPDDESFSFVTNRAAAIVYRETKVSLLTKLGPYIATGVTVGPNAATVDYIATRYSTAIAKKLGAPSDEDLKQLFIYPYDNLDIECTDIIA